MPNFIYLPPFGYLNLKNVTQVHNPDDKTVDLDKGRITVHFASPIMEGRSSVTSRVLLSGEDMQFVVAALGLLKAPRSLADLKLKDPISFPPADSIGE